MANSFDSTLTNSAILKNFYAKGVRSQFNDDVALYRGASVGKEMWSGVNVIRAAKVRRNQGVGSTTDGGTLPQIGQQTSVQATIPAKYNYLRFGITGPMIKASRDSRGAFVQAGAFEVDEGYRDLKNDINRQLSWSGNGNLARVNTTANSSNTLVIKGREDTAYALQYLDVGAVFDVYTGTTLTQAGVTITAIQSGNYSSLTATLTVSPAVTVTANDILVRSGVTPTSDISGLLYTEDGLTTTVYGIDRSQYIAYQGNVTDVAGAQLTLDIMQQTYLSAQRLGGRKMSAIFMDPNSVRMYTKLLTADKRFTNTVDGDGGFANKGEKYQEFNGVPIINDKDFPSRIAMIPEDTLTKYVLCDFEFASETGDMYIAQTSADALEARLRFFANLYNEQPSAIGMLTNYISP